MKDIQIAHIGGDSRGQTWTFMTDLTLEDQISGTIWPYDIDSGVAGNNEVIGNRLVQRDDAKGDWKLETSASLKNALIGYDFVIISTLPGIFGEMESDAHFPKHLEVCRSADDMAGPGGMVRVLRIIPMFVETVRAIRGYAPKAWVIDYTNPMPLYVKTLHHIFPEIKAFGYCHEVFDTQKVLERVCEESSGETGIDWHDIHVDALGINHFTWLSSASYKGIGLFPVYREYIDRHFNRGYEVEDENWMSSFFKCVSQVEMGLFKRYGLIAAVGDRHLAEFMPGNEYLSDLEIVASRKFGLTTVQWREGGLKERLERGRGPASGGEEVELKPTGEEGTLLIKALCSLTGVISNVNISNTTCQITNLSAGALAETNAVFEKDHTYPVVMGAVPENVEEPLMPHLESHELIMEAAFNPDRGKVVRAFMSDPLVRGKDCREEGARLLVDDMIENTFKYLPEGWEQTKMKHNDELLKFTDAFIINLAPVPKKELFYDATGGPFTHFKT